MGVKGLWRLLLPIGRRISIETLEGKILAIDASIWLTQFLKAMRDPQTGSVLPAAHLIGFLRRLSKLRFHGIRPVLVFDGATPEIKLRELQQRRQRREQFASESNASNLQRLAKRLLMEQLQKEKLEKMAKQGKTKSRNGAFAPGFTLEEEQEQVPGEEEKVINVDDPDQSVRAKPHPLQEEEDVLVDCTGLEAIWKEPLNQESTPNDWDQPIVLDEDDEISNDDRDDDDRQQVQPPHHHHDGNEQFSIDRISSLPSSMRKEAIENAKRQQRMKSRREFMPVAGQPDQYSQTQLRNFLRSSRLNQDIVSMVQQQNRNDGCCGDGHIIGERVASDSSRRIVFTKEITTTGKSRPMTTGSDGAGHDWKRLHKETSLRKDDGDEEFEWDESSGQAKHDELEDCNSRDHLKLSPQNPGRKRPAVVNSDDDDSTVYATSAVTAQDSGGGFLNEECSVFPLDARVKERASAVTEEGDFLSSSRSPPLNDDHEGFVLGNQSISAPFADRERFLIASSTRGNAVQELEDACLARALQESEDTHVSISGPRTAPRQEAPGDGRDGNDIIDSENESDENVDWEDADSGKDDMLPGGALAEVEQSEHRRRFLDFDVRNSTHGHPLTKDSEEESFCKEEFRSGSGERVEGIHDASLTVKTESVRLVAAPSNKLTQTDPLPEESVDEVGQENAQQDGNSQALAHAQETASHLTDWAARAFRRAIAQHEEEQGLRHSGSFESHAEKETDMPASENAATGTVSQSLSQEAASHSENIEKRPERSVVDVTNAGARATGDPNLPMTASLADVVAGVSEDRQRQERDAGTITDEVKAEILELIQLFGIPYVEAPAEAEAQCVALEEMGLVDGIVTEDSDVFVFGGTTVYKNIFDDQKYVEVYRSEDAKRDLALGRNEMIALAMLMGGDYTEGVKGVGIVNGMEILQAFDVSENLKSGLSAFRQWLDGFDPAGIEKLNAEHDSLSLRNAFQAKHRTARSRWIAPRYFPADNVLNAYVNPVVDRSSETFTWGMPDLDSLLVFCRLKLGWDEHDTKRLIEPVLERLENPSRQTRLDSFFMSYDDNIKFANVRSKRLRDVFNIIQESRDGSAEANSAIATKRTKTGIAHD